MHELPAYQSLTVGAPAAVPVPVVVLAGGALLVALLLLLLWSLKRRRDPHLLVRAGAPLPELLPSITGLTYGTSVGGNHVELLEDGAYFDALLADVAAAERSVHFETYLWKDGEIGRRLAAALAERARAGVAVRVLVDAQGGKKMGEGTVRLLEEAGCRFAWYHPVRLHLLAQFNKRDHRKLCVVDGCVGYVGGHCVTDNWLGEAQDRHHFRDLSARIRGPLVHALQSTFSENWTGATGELFLGADVFPDLRPEGEVEGHVARIAPAHSASAVKVLHHVVIGCARERIWIQNPYFLPDPTAIRALGEAAARGVDVRVMVPAPSASDMPLVQYAGHFRFDDLLAGGVRLFEYQHTLLHQKVMTVDGVWCAIGSSNFDDRSFEINDEITVGFHDAGLAGALEGVFRKDLAQCVERTLDEWRRRSPLRRLAAAALFVLNEQL